MHTEHRSKGTLARHLGRRLSVLFSLTTGLVLVGVVLLWTRAWASVVEAPPADPAPTTYGEYGVSYVFRFSPTVQAFEFFTIPTAGAAPDGVAVRDGAYPTEVWFAESGADRVGRLVYTSTADYVLREYELPAGSRPLNILVDDTGDAWFTENGRSRIGYIDASTGITYEFPISTTDVAPMDLDMAPDGSIWFTERATDHIGQLIVTTTADYEIREFFDVRLADGGLSGVLARENDKIWVVLSNQNRLVRLQPSVPRVDPTGSLSEPSNPLMLALSPDGNRLWFTELHGNRVSGVFMSTLQFGLRYSVPTTHSFPYALDVDSTGDIWFSEQLGGKIGRLTLTPVGTFTEFTVTLPYARVQGLDVGSDDAVWFVADTWYTLNLPLVIRQ